MATKRLRNGKWAYQIRNKALLGDRLLHLTFADEAEGDAYVAHLEALLRAGVLPPEYAARPTEPVTIEDTISAYRQSQAVSPSDDALLDVIGREIGGIKLSELSYAWAEREITRLRRELNIAPGTIRHRIGAIARCLDWAVRSGKLIANPLRQLPRGYATYTPADAQALAAVGKATRIDVSRDRRLQPGEEDRIRAVLADTSRRMLDRDAMTILFDIILHTAMRLREVFTLQRSQIDLPERAIYVERSKTGARRVVPIFSPLLDPLSTYLAALEGDALFPWVRPSADRERELQRVTSLLSARFADLFRSAGCEGLREHDLRHEAASRIHECGLFSETEADAIVGHTGKKMRGRYVHFRPLELAGRL